MTDPNWNSRAEMSYIMDYPNEVDMIAFHIDTEMDRLERDMEMLQSSHGDYREMIIRDVATTRNIISHHVSQIIRLCVEEPQDTLDPCQIHMFQKDDVGL